MYLQDLNVLKEVPGYKVLLKAVIKSQIQMLVRIRWGFPRLAILQFLATKPLLEQGS